MMIKLKDKRMLVFLVSVIYLITCVQAIPPWVISTLGGFQWFFEMLVDILLKMLLFVISQFIDIIEDSLLANPTMYPLVKEAGGAKWLTPNGKIMAVFLKVLIPFYVFAVLLAGVKFIFMSHSPHGRAQAKMMLEKLIVSMILVSISPAIYQLQLEFSHALTVGVLNTMKNSILEPGSTLGHQYVSSIENIPMAARLSFIFIFFFILVALEFALLIIWFRYLAVKLLAFIFPFTLFMYLFDWTRHLGVKMLKFTIIWIYAPVIGALWLGIGAAVIKETTTTSTLAAQLMAPVFLIVTLLMVGIMPSAMSGLLKWLGGILSMVGMVVPGPWGLVLTGLGGIMQGQSPTAAIMIGTKAGFSKIGRKAKELRDKAQSPPPGKRKGKPPGRIESIKDAEKKKAARSAGWLRTKGGRYMGSSLAGRLAKIRESRTGMVITAAARAASHIMRPIATAQKLGAVVADTGARGMNAARNVAARFGLREHAYEPESFRGRGGRGEKRESTEQTQARQTGEGGSREGGSSQSSDRHSVDMKTNMKTKQHIGYGAPKPKQPDALDFAGKVLDASEEQTGEEEGGGEEGEE